MEASKPEISIEQSTFERLQRHATPFVDTPDTVVNRALDALELRRRPATPRNGPFVTARQIDPRLLPNLTHTKVLDATLRGEHIDRPNWNQLVDRVLILAMEQRVDFDELRKLYPVNLVRGCKVDEGYRHLAEVDVSVQGLAANVAGRALVTLAQGLGIDFDVTFIWRSKEGAARPGERGHLSVARGP